MNVRSMWIRLSIIVILITLPLLAIQWKLEGDALQLIKSVHDQTKSKEQITSHMEDLKRLAILAPKEASSYKKKYSILKSDLYTFESINELSGRLVHEVRMQSLYWVLGGLSFGMLAAWFIAKNMVQHFDRLLKFSEEKIVRTEALKALESWQQLAKHLIHELRAPLTPIKLILTDLDTQVFESEGAIKDYLARALPIAYGQMHVIENMITDFTRFSKLPGAVKMPVKVSDLIRQFFDKYSKLDLEHLILSVSDSVPDVYLLADTELLHQAFFNLVKNSMDANADKKVHVHIDVNVTEDKKTCFSIKNDGRAIPKNIETRIFEMGFSTDQSGHNLGLGLSIVRKIALEHGGDLSLARNDESNVIFELEVQS